MRASTSINYPALHRFYLDTVPSDLQISYSIIACLLLFILLCIIEKDSLFWQFHAWYHCLRAKFQNSKPGVWPVHLYLLSW